MPAGITSFDAPRCSGKMMVARRVLLLAGVFAAPLAQSLEVRPSIQVGVVYTDNLFLNDKDEVVDGVIVGEVDDIVTRLDPSIAISHTSPRVDFEGQYTYTYLRFSEAEDSDASFSQGTANLDLTLVQNAFFLESVVEQTQQIIDPQNSVWYSNVPLVDNRTDQLRMETSPHLDTEISGVSIDSRYVIGSVTYDSSGLEDADYQQTETAIGGTERGKGLSWGLFHEYEAYDYDNFSDDKSQLAYGTLTYGFRQAGDVFVFGSLGKESSYEDFSDASLEDTYWQIGFRNVTGRRLVEAAFGDRSFGSTVYGLVRQEITRGSVELAYREEPSVQEQLYERRQRDSTTPPQPDIPPGIERPGVGSRFVYKLASATLIKELGRNRLEASVFNEIRDEILDNGVRPTDAVQDSEEQTGFSVALSRELGRRTTVGLEGEMADREFRNGNTDRISAVRLTGNYQLGQKMGLEGYVARYSQNGSTLETDDYNEFQVGLFLSYDFL